MSTFTPAMTNSLMVAVNKNDLTDILMTSAREIKGNSRWNPADGVFGWRDHKKQIKAVLKKYHCTS